MKTLELDHLEKIKGGDAVEVVDGVCMAVTLMGLFRFSIPGLNYAAYACVGWGIARGAGWI